MEQVEFCGIMGWSAERRGRLTRASVTVDFGSEGEFGERSWVMGLWETR